MMTSLEMIISGIAVCLAVVLSAYSYHLAKTSGRDRPHDPERVRRFVKNAPMERLDKVLDRN